MQKCKVKGNRNLTKLQSAPSSTLQAGDLAELAAKAFLIKQGLTFIRAKYRTYCGEIDLIMKDQNEIVFVEVRYLKHTHFVEPFETVAYPKQKRLIKTALLFLQACPWTDHYDSRFDVIGISGDQLNYKITWITDAFGVQ